MKNCLLLLVLVALVAVAAPAYSVTLYMDVNGDGLNSLLEKQNGNNSAPDDVLGPGTTSIDFYYDTNHNPDGSTELCPQAPEQPYDMFSYEGTVRYSGSGTVTFNGFTDNLGFPVGIITVGDHFFATVGTDAWFGHGSAVTAPLGKNKVGTLSVTVTGTPKLDFATTSTIDPSSAQTAFGSHCYGPTFDNTIRLGEQNIPLDHAFGTEAPVPTVQTTWGKIKSLYH